MKKKILAPFLSALVIPGLGQLINGQIAKGSMILGGVATLFMLIVIKVFFDVTQALKSIPHAQWGPELAGDMAAVLARQNHTLLSILLLALALLWVYSVADAYKAGKKLDGGG
jgi:TM2 domain-containing membrane protein YozV